MAVRNFSASSSQDFRSREACAKRARCPSRTVPELLPYQYGYANRAPHRVRNGYRSLATSWNQLPVKQ